MFSRMKGFFNPPATIPALQYKVTIYNNDLEWARDEGHELTEIFIPSKNLAFNNAGACFHAEKARNESARVCNGIITTPLTELQIPGGLVALVEKITNASSKYREENINKFSVHDKNLTKL